MAWTSLNPKSAYGWIDGGGGGGLGVYSETNSDPNVTALWYFDEASGDIVDEISGITCSVVSTPTFNQTATGLYANISPGILYPVDTGKYHLKNAPEVTMDPGTGDLTVEYWYTSTRASSYSIPISTRVIATGRGLQIEMYPAGTFDIYIKAEDDSAVSASMSYGAATPFDGNPHFVRVSLNRSGNVTIRLDEVSLGTASLAAIAGKNVVTGRIEIPGFATGNEMIGRMYVLRWSLNSTNNLVPVWLG